MGATYWSMDECCWVSWSSDWAQAGDPVAVDWAVAIPAQPVDGERPVRS